MLNQQIAQQQADAQIEQDQKSFWSKMLKTDLLKGIFMMIPSIFFGAFSFTAVLGLTKAIEGTVTLSPLAYTAFKSKQHRKRIDSTVNVVGGQGVDSVKNSIMDSTKKPSELDGVKTEIDKTLEGESMPSISNYNSVNPNPKTESRNDLVHKFQQIQLIDTLMAESISFGKKIELENKQKLQQGKENTETAQEFQGFFNKRLSTIRGSYSFLALQKLDRQMELLSQIEYEGNLVYNKLVGVFGSINYHVLTAIFKKQGDGETLTWLENLISGIGAFIMGGPAPNSGMVFDPQGEDLKYPLNDNDNPDIELIKTILNIIYENKDKIALNVELKYLDNGDITPTILGQILGVHRSQIYRYLEQIEKALVEPVTYTLQDVMYVKLSAGVRKTTSENLEYVQNLMDGSITRYVIKKYGKIPFTLNLQSIFSAHATPVDALNPQFSQITLSEALGRGSSYIGDMKTFKGKFDKERTNKYFKLATLINLLDETKVKPNEENSISKIKEESLNLIFEEMKNVELVHSDKMRPLFDLTLQMLTTLTIATKPRSANEIQKIVTLADLSKIASKRVTEGMLSLKFKRGYPLAFAQGERIKTELRKNYFTSAREHIDQTIDAISDTFHKNEQKYHKYFGQELYIPQIFELFSITFGLDVFSQSFTEDAIQSEISGKWNIDVSRHHPQENKDAFTLFDIQKNGFLINLIPLLRLSHITITRQLRLGSTVENQLALARFLHLYELKQKLYVVGKDYCADFLKEFTTKTTDVYEGGQMESRRLWNNLNQGDIERYVIHWIDMKETPSESIVDNNKFFSKRYPNWYHHTFKPYMDDLSLFLQQSPITNKPDFWHWFVNTYIKEDGYPFSDNPFS